MAAGVALAVLVGLVVGTPGASASEAVASAADVAEPAAALTLPIGGDVLDGLVETGTEHACGGLLALLDADGALLGCTHGHDEPAVAAAAPQGSADATAAQAAPCHGDGRSGMRVQVIFARPSTSIDRYPLVEGRLRDALGAMTHGLDASARAAGGGRQVRFVTDGCSVVIDRVTVSASAARSFTGVSDALRTQGYTDARRKYLVFMDHADYCGLGTLPVDREPGIGNAANGRAGTWGMALVGSPCFDSVPTAAQTAMHELLHTVGAVPDHAPNSTGQGHCSDAADVMCYDDGSGTPIRSVCPAASPFRVDCRNDDYFHPAPPAGHRLTQTWNVANSSFFAGSAYADWTDPTAPAVRAVAHEDGVDLSWPAPGSRYVRQLRVLRDGQSIATLPPSARSYEDAKASAGKEHSYQLEVIDQLGYVARSGSASATRPRKPLLPSLGPVLDPVEPSSPPDGSPPTTGGGDGKDDDTDGGGKDDDTDGGGKDDKTDPTGTRPAISSRRSGPDRFATAADISRTAFRPGVARVYVATGGDFPDALSAGAAAALSGGPVLLTARGSLPAATAEELRRLDAGEVIVVGGPGAVSEAVLASIQKAAGAPTRRLSGSDRFATAGAVAVDVATPGGTVYLATGAGFADALAGVPAAATERAALLLVTRESVPAPTAQALDALRPREVVVLGGQGAVADAVVDDVRRLTGAQVVRVAGPDRFSTAAAVAARAFPHGSPIGHIATGSGFADALAGGPAAAANGGPLLLVMRDALPGPTAEEVQRLAPDEIVVLGGEGAVSKGTEAAATTAASRP